MRGGTLPGRKPDTRTCRDSFLYVASREGFRSSKGTSTVSLTLVGLSVSLVAFTARMSPGTTSDGGRAEITAAAVTPACPTSYRDLGHLRGPGNPRGRRAPLTPRAEREPGPGTLRPPPGRVTASRGNPEEPQSLLASPRSSRKQLASSREAERRASWQPSGSCPKSGEQGSPDWSSEARHRGSGDRPRGRIAAPGKLPEGQRTGVPSWSSEARHRGSGGRPPGQHRGPLGSCSEGQRTGVPSGSGRGDSNSRSPAPKAGALATTLRPVALRPHPTGSWHRDHDPGPTNTLGTADGAAAADHGPPIMDRAGKRGRTAPTSAFRVAISSA